MDQNAPVVKEAEAGPQLKYLEPEVSARNVWEHDRLGRKAMASKLISLVQHQTHALTISLDGGWGTGKTFFLKRWEQQLQDEGFHAIYFNAWEDDFHADPLVAIVGQLTSQLTKFAAERGGLSERAKKSIKAIKENAKPLLYSASNMLLAHLTGLQLPPVGSSGQKSIFEKYEEQAESLSAFRAELKALVEIAREKTHKPLIFVVDELDRCRPTFSIELLERVKHLFGVEGLVFVFGINRSELCQSIKAVYGEIDADIYLRRFFDVNFLLLEEDLESYCRHLLDQYELQEFFTESDLGRQEAIGFAHAFSSISKHLDLSLRDVDYCIRALAVVGRSFGTPKPLIPLGRYMLIALILLRIKEPKLYRSIVHKVNKKQVVGVEIATQIAQWRIDDEELDKDTLFLFDHMELSAYAVCTDRNNSQGNPFLAYLGSPASHTLVEVPKDFPESTRSNESRLEKLSEYTRCEGQLGFSSVTAQLVPSLVKRMELVDLPRYG